MNSFEKFKADFQGKNALVLGLGLLGGGIKLVEFLDQVGCNITVSDQKTAQELSEITDQLKDIDIEYSLGSHDISVLDGIDFIIRNPSVPRNHPFLIEAIKKDIPIYMEAALFTKYTQKPVIGITGTRGKTTTSTLLQYILKSTKKTCNLAGNIPGTCALSLLQKESTSKNWGTILELSSWQLQGFEDLEVSPHISILTNIYPDHLNRYKGIEEYIKDKQVISAFQNSDDHFIFNGNQKEVVLIAEQSKANKIDFQKAKIPEGVTPLLMGSHNLENIKACITVASILDISISDIAHTIKSFHPVPFRLEPIRNISQVTYINDTTSTTPVAMEAAINSIETPIIIIMGGNSKNLPLESMINTLNSNSQIKQIVMLPGSGSDEISSHLNSFKKVKDLKQALELSKKLSSPGDTVLFSPGFTSFSQFKNEFDRGEQFNQLVNSL